MQKSRQAIPLILLAFIMAGITRAAVPGRPSMPQVEQAVMTQPTVRPTLTAEPTAANTSTPTASQRAFTPTPAWTRAATGRISAAGATKIPPTPTTAPTVLSLPPSASIKGMSGFAQLLPLSCEARSAADWSRYYKINVYEYEFFTRLPRSNNPEEGFVGNVRGEWGQVPPNPYGVHAAPVAKLLREYGAKARAVRNLPFELLLAEIAAGRPVIVWVTGHVAPGKGQPYEVDGKVVTVAPFEHTVIIIGYDTARKQVTVLDGKKVYDRDYEIFLSAWSPLENMAIVWDEALP